MSKIVLEDFNGGDGYYKINLAYLNKEQIKEIEALVSKWNPVEESEDERIRKLCKELIESSFINELCNKEERDACINWMEKQGKQELPQVYETVDGEIITYSESEGYKVVEPKFKIGDWICNDGNSYLIADINLNKRRYLFKVGGYTNRFINWESIENADKNYHLWTIQDAKQGDVLTDNLDCFNNPFIFILKRFENVYFGLPKPSDFSSHCFLTMSDKQEFREGDYHHMHNICPATKEQRSLLFEKMHKAGYEWDTEKKELKKIEQKPKKISIWKHWKDGIAGGEEGKQIYLIKSGLKYSISSCLGQECDYIELSELDELLREEKQGKWSKEDEYHWMRCIKCLEWCSTPKGNDFYETVKWLESLKQRMKEC